LYFALIFSNKSFALAISCGNVSAHCGDKKYVTISVFKILGAHNFSISFISSHSIIQKFLSISWSSFNGLGIFRQSAIVSAVL